VYVYNGDTSQQAQITSGILTVSPVQAGQATATIDASSLTTSSNYPVITGTVTNAMSLDVSIKINGNSIAAFNPTISNNRWSGVPPVAIQSGSYPVTVTNLVGGATLSTGILVVTGTSMSTYPQSNMGTITVSTSGQPSNTLAPQGAIVPFTSVTLTNTGTNPVTLNNITFQRNGATDAVFQGFSLTDELGVVTPLTITSVYGTYQNHLAQFAAPITIAAGQSKTLTLKGKMASNLASYDSQIVGFDNTNITYTTMGSGQLPIVGASDTINSTLNVCYPPQTLVYGYQCW
jgi:hypothetical protein